MADGANFMGLRCPRCGSAWIMVVAKVGVLLGATGIEAIDYVFGEPGDHVWCAQTTDAADCGWSGSYRDLAEATSMSEQTEKPKLTVAEVERRLRENRATLGRNDINDSPLKIIFDVLLAIRDGADDPAALAKAGLGDVNEWEGGSP